MTNEAPSNNSITSITSSKPKTAHVAGSTRATLAIIFSVLALSISGYQLWQSMDEKDGKIISPLVTEKASHADVDSRLKAQENTLTVMNDTFKKQLDVLEQKLNAVPAQKEVSADIAGTAAAMQIKLADWDKQNAELRQQIKAELLNKSKNIAALALLEHVSRKAQLGLSFQGDIKELENVVAPNPTSAHAYNLLKGFDKPLTSDTALLAELHTLIPDFLAREKLDKTDNIFDKIGIQLQKLVVVRRKNGQVSDDTPIGKSLDALQTAIISGDWPRATSIASTFAEKDAAHVPKDFPAWHDKLRDRALTDEAVNALQHLVLNDLQGVAVPTIVEPKTESKSEPKTKADLPVSQDAPKEEP
ncbi:MAG: hypothetical protein K2Q32_03350 [Alphaproteobacteria bacterium]|nr:hypothetical protein [Alphaproteobacteria bacterium]